MSDTFAVIVTAEEKTIIESALAFRTQWPEESKVKVELRDKVRLAERESCNGWTNAETWTANLWLANEQGTSEHARELCDPAHGRTHHENGRLLRSYVEELTDEAFGTDAASMAKDMLRSALDRVVWREVAEHFAER